jgi:hypothetical protein
VIAYLLLEVPEGQGGPKLAVEPSDQLPETQGAQGNASKRYRSHHHDGRRLTQNKGNSTYLEPDTSQCAAYVFTEPLLSLVSTAEAIAVIPLPHFPDTV